MDDMFKGGSIKDDFESASNYSERIDQIIAVKAGDPRQTKQAAQEAANKKLEPALKKSKKDSKPVAMKEVPKIPSFGNMDFYRQPETRN